MKNKLKDILPMIVVFICFFAVFCFMSILDEYNAKQENAQATKTISEDNIIEYISPCQAARGTENVLIIQDELLLLYRCLTPDQVNKVLLSMMSATACETYEAKLLNAYCFRNRIAYYGFDSYLLWMWVEPQFDFDADPPEWHADRLLQFAECRRALEEAFQNWDKYPELFYYQNPADSSPEGLKDFERYQFVIREDDVWAYNIEPECSDKLIQKRAEYING